MPPVDPRLAALLDIATPAYVADLARLKANAAVAAKIKEAAGAKILLALKAFSQWSAFAPLKEVLDGATASGPYEARLAAEEFGGEVHVYSPAYSESDVLDCLNYAGHVYFNSIDQLARFAPLARARRADVKVGLRVNPGLSLVKNSALYDPSAPGSRFGVQPEEVTDAVLDQIDILHVHNLCENLAADSVRLIDHVIDRFGSRLGRVEAVNLGGGHYVTHKDYDLDSLIAALRRLTALGPEVILEPGAALCYDAGYLVSTVLDVFEGQGRAVAILDTSASAHMPDVLEVPYAPPVLGAGAPGELGHDVTLGGKTCMTGDVIGSYSFAEPLKVGDTVIFGDLAQYALVKNTTFNGMPLPDIGVLDEAGRYRVVKRFGYEDFKGRLS